MEYSYSKAKVRIIGVTQPTIPECTEAGELVAFVARVSNPKNQSNAKTAPKLLKYLADHHHWSPFEMGHVLMEIETTRDIAHQILRHRSFSFQEFSQRYAVAQDFVLRETRLQDKSNRQNSLPCNDPAIEREFEIMQTEVIHFTSERYTRALALGIAKEQARVLLSEGLTLTKLYMVGSIRSWIHYSQVRTDLSTQKEHRDVALQCWKLLLETFPAIADLAHT